jgi:hypothetical protein
MGPTVENLVRQAMTGTVRTPGNDASALAHLAASVQVIKALRGSAFCHKGDNGPVALSDPQSPWAAKSAKGHRIG